MNKTLISIEELKQIALREIHTYPGGEDVSAVGICPVTDEVVESNWSVQVTSAAKALTLATNRAAIYAQHKFRHEYNLLTGQASHAGIKRLSTFWAAVRSLLPLPVASKASPAARQLSLPPLPMQPRDCDRA